MNSLFEKIPNPRKLQGYIIYDITIARWWESFPDAVTLADVPANYQRDWLHYHGAESIEHYFAREEHEREEQLWRQRFCNWSRGIHHAGLMALMNHKGRKALRKILDYYDNN